MKEDIEYWGEPIEQEYSSPGSTSRWPESIFEHSAERICHRLRDYDKPFGMDKEVYRRLEDDYIYQLKFWESTANRTGEVFNVSIPF